MLPPSPAIVPATISAPKAATTPSLSPATVAWQKYGVITPAMQATLPPSALAMMTASHSGGKRGSGSKGWGGKDSGKGKFSKGGKFAGPPAHAPDEAKIFVAGLPKVISEDEVRA